MKAAQAPFCVTVSASSSQPDPQPANQQSRRAWQWNTFPATSTAAAETGMAQLGDEPEDFSSLLQAPACEWDLEAELDLVGPPLLAPGDARSQLGQGEDLFLTQLAHVAGSGSPDCWEPYPGPASEGSSEPLQAHPAQHVPLSHPQQRSKAEAAAETRAKNRAAQRKSRARKKVHLPGRDAGHARACMLCVSYEASGASKVNA